MNPSLFHFSHAMWLWGLLAIPLMFAAYVMFLKHPPANRLLERFADKELLPHLIKNRGNTGATWKKMLLIWSLAWFFGMIAMAGPQGRYTDVQLFKPSKNLVILLDLSSSMNATDLKPSRLVRAREEISDLIDMNHGLTIGLVAYAEIPHMVVPLTDDMRTIHNLLPSLDTSLITVDGDRLKPALEMASHMLGGEPGQNKSILVVSDGDFAENDIADLAAAAKGAVINTMGVGTAEGAPITSPDGGWVKDAKGQILIDRLHADRLQALSAAGHGIYVQATYDNSDTHALLNHIGGASDDALVGGKTIRTWDEGFYIPALVLALLLLPWFRKGVTFLALLMLLATPTHKAQAADIKDWFHNPAQQGETDFAAGHYDEAIKKFSDPYQQGVAAYKAGQFAEAAALFKAATSEKNPNLAAEYNLGNAQLMQNSPEDAIKSYETVLKQNPDDASAKHNLVIARKLLQQKQQQQKEQQSENSKSQESKQDQQKSAAGQSSEQKQDQKNGEQKNQTGQGQSQQGENNPQTSQNQKGPSGQEQSGGQQKQQQQGQTPQPQSTQQQGENKAQQQAGQKDESQPSSQQSATHGQQREQQQPSQKTGMSSAQGKPLGSQEPTQNQASSSSQADTQAADSRNGQPNDQATVVRPRTQLDINVDQWLNHIQSDPGSFLKNQFMIEEKKSAEGQEEKQQ
jgi:Ca-activated chloride channel family protein